MENATVDPRGWQGQQKADAATTPCTEVKRTALLVRPQAGLLKFCLVHKPPLSPGVQHLGANQRQQKDTHEFQSSIPNDATV